MQTIELNKVEDATTLMSLVEIQGVQVDISIAKMDMYRKGIKKFMITEHDIELKTSEFGHDNYIIKTYQVLDN